MRYRTLVLISWGLLATASVAFGAAAGDPDLSFGTNGAVTTKVGDASEAYDLVRQSDGKVVIGGYVEEGLPASTQFLLVRYLADGSVDPSFGTNGIVQTDALPGQSTRVKSLLVQSDDKLVAVGFGAADDYWDAGGDVVLARYLPDGALDPDFGVGGIVVTDVFGFPDQGSKTVLQPDGRIVVVGFTQIAAPAASQDALIARYETNGALDATFGTGGTVALDFGGHIDRAYDVVLQADGSIVIAGILLDPILSWSGPSSGILARVDANGIPDPTFGTGGSTELVLGMDTGITNMIQLPDGDLLATGSYSTDGISGFTFLARFDADGSPDLGFGDGDGILDPAPGLFFGLGLDANGAVLGTGPGFLWGHWFALGVTRLVADGTPDPTFGDGGRASIYVGQGYNAGSFAVVAEPDGSSITMAGFATDGPYEIGEGPRYIALARVLGTSAACSSDADCDVCEHCSAGQCANGPRTTCEHPQIKGAKLTYAGGPVTPRVLWKWKPIAGSPGFDPMTEATGLCMWWGTTPIYESRIPAATGWTIGPTGSLSFRDKTRSNFGIEKIKVGRSGIDVRATGANMRNGQHGFGDALLQPSDPTIPLYVQLNASGGKCYSARYTQNGLPGKYPGHVRRGLGY